MNADVNDPSSGSGRHVLLRALGFSLCLALVFTFIANTLPQVEGEAPAEQEVDIGTLNLDSFVALGESVFRNKGTCTLCHNDRGRAPDLLAADVTGTATARLKDERYQGQATDAESYIRESMLEPGLYVVKGYGKKGSNDTISPMPAMDKPPIQLNKLEIEAVIAFLQGKDGNPITVKLPTALPAAAASAESTNSPAVTPLPATMTTAEEVIGKYMCAACHSIMSTTSPVGPDLKSIGARMSAEEIRQSIMYPDAVIREGFPASIMPQDFVEKMTVKELEMLVKFLAEQQG